MSEAETTLAMAERHVREFEDLVADQELRADELERDGHIKGAAMARELLATMCETLQIAREHVEIERRKTQFASPNSN